MTQSADANAQAGAAETEAEDPSTTAIRVEVRDFLKNNWNPDLQVGEWWEKLADAHWAVPTWPEASFGRGLSRGDAGVVVEEIKAAGGEAMARSLSPPGPAARPCLPPVQRIESG